MPFICEDCGEIGARMNTLFGIRLCVECSKSIKYKLMCKSKVLSEYLLTKTDLDSDPNPPQEYLVKNPHYKSGPPMVLYLEIEIQRVFLSKYDNLINNILMIQNPLSNMKNTINFIMDYFKEQKHTKQKAKYNKILIKYNVGSEIDLPNWVQIKLQDAKSVAEYERIVSSYFRFIELHKLLKKENLSKYIDHQICHEYIYQNNKQIILYQIPIIIKFMLEKKRLMVKAIKEHNINKSKYAYEISQYINSYDLNPVKKTIQNDLDMLIEYINKIENVDNERKLRTRELTEKLKLRGLALRSDSVLCSNYITGSLEYTCDEIVDIMEQMDWFFTNTKYSIYSKQYDNEQYQARKYFQYDSYNSYNSYDSNDSYDSDDSDDSYYYKSMEKIKIKYNKRKSEYVKKKCLEEWIINGKKGSYPKSLNPQIEKIEKELLEKKNPQKNQQKNQQKNSHTDHPCSNSKCLNIYSIQCANKMCKKCCNSIGCEIHKKIAK